MEEDSSNMELIMEAMEQLGTNKIPIHWSHRQHR
jgi:hypothetical protein